MKWDITPLLREWPHKPGQINARLIEGDDGMPRVQVRLDLGLLQMHADGRPDGERPFGHTSFLEYVEARIDAEIAEVREAEPSVATEQPKVQSLTSDECRALREEAAQYYQRYVACLALEDFDRVVRDTTRNLRVLDLCAEHAAEEHDKTVLEQFRPYIVMVRARALASAAIRDDELKAAVLALDDALELLKGHFADRGGTTAFEGAEEVRMLRAMREALAPKLPVSLKAELRQRLQRAIEQENYELAAILRDELKQLPDKDAPKA